MGIQNILISKSYVAFNIAEYLKHKGDAVKYLTVTEWQRKVVDDAILIGNPGKEFNDFTNKLVNDYIFKKKAPPAGVATAVMNIADDFLNNREVVLRAGDYIALQNEMRTTTLKK